MQHELPQRVTGGRRAMSAATAAFLGSGRRMRADGCTADHCQPGLRLAVENRRAIIFGPLGLYDCCADVRLAAFGHSLPAASNHKRDQARAGYQ
jgi:hypothetical protein